MLMLMLMLNQNTRYWNGLIADCGIFDCGLRIYVFNPQSAIRNPQSAIKYSSPGGGRGK
jgi:hypothetical protein